MDRKVRIEYFQVRGGKTMMWPAWFSESLRKGESKLLPDRIVIFNGKNKSVVREGDFIARAPSGKVFKLEFENEEGKDGE